MSKLLRFPDRDRIREEAAGWLARLDGDPLTADERERLDRWLAADRRHRKTLQSLARLWGDMGCLTLLAELFPIAAEPDMPTRRAPGLRSAAVAAVAAMVLALIGGALYVGQPAPEAALEQRYETRRGEQTRVLLADGSIMQLNTDSAASVRFDEHERTIRLTQGEAHFNVAKNPARPFVVYAGQGRVRATGTAFNVRLQPTGVGVLVDEGTVEVQAQVTPNVAADAQPSQPVKVSRGGSTRFDGAVAAPVYLPPAQLAQRLAWRSGKWQFDGETLAEVIGEVSRYTDKTIEITDPRVASIRVGGYFNIGEVDALLSVLEAGFGVRVTRVDDNRILLSALDSPSPDDAGARIQ